MATTWTYGYFNSTTTSSINTTYLDPWITNNVYKDDTIKQYPKEKDKKVFLILNSKEKSYKVAPDDCHF